MKSLKVKNTLKYRNFTMKFYNQNEKWKIKSFLTKSMIKWFHVSNKKHKKHICESLHLKVNCTSRCFNGPWSVMYFVYINYTQHIKIT